jgi:DNA repair ATPase RecN
MCYSFKRTQRQYKEGGKIYDKWVCSVRNAKGASACINDVFIRDDDITEATKQYLTSILQNKKTLVADITKKVRQMIDDKNNNTSANRFDIERKINILINKKQKYMEMFTNEVITIVELKEYTKGINEEKEKLEIELNLMQNSDVVIADIGKIINNHFSIIEELVKTDDLKNELLKQVLEYKCFPDGTVKIDLKVVSNHDLNITVPLTNILSHCNESNELYLRII